MISPVRRNWLDHRVETYIRVKIRMLVVVDEPDLEASQMLGRNKRNVAEVHE